MKLELVPTVEAHLETLYGFQQDSASRHMAAFMPPEVTHLGQFVNRWNGFLSDPSVVSRTIFVEDELVGSVGKYEVLGEAELTYWVRRDLWGRGIATSACRKFLAEMTTRPLHARAVTDNAGSIRVLEKLGFERLGTDRGFSHVRNAEVEEVVMILIR